MEFNPEWKTLYRVGGIAAVVAAILFRRNIGAEVSLFTGVDAIPIMAVDWFSLLHSNPFVGMSLLAVFDLFNYFLEGMFFLALAVAFWQVNKSRMVLALASGFVGIAVSFSTNISLTMYSLSNQYAATQIEAQRSVLLASGQAVLGSNLPLAGSPSTGMYMSLLLIALAGLLISVSILSTNRATAIVGLLAGSCDLVYCLTFPYSLMLQIILMSLGGVFWMIWHLLVARVLLKHL